MKHDIGSAVYKEGVESGIFFFASKSSNKKKFVIPHRTIRYLEGRICFSFVLFCKRRNRRPDVYVTLGIASWEWGTTPEKFFVLFFLRTCTFASSSRVLQWRAQ